jgi:hypothetical protein
VRGGSASSTGSGRAATSASAAPTTGGRAEVRACVRRVDRARARLEGPGAEARPRPVSSAFAAAVPELERPPFAAPCGCSELGGAAG